MFCIRLLYCRWTEHAGKMPDTRHGLSTIAVPSGNDRVQMVGHLVPRVCKRRILRAVKSSWLRRTREQSSSSFSSTGQPWQLPMLTRVSHCVSTNQLLFADILPIVNAPPNLIFLSRGRLPTRPECKITYSMLTEARLPTCLSCMGQPPSFMTPSTVCHALSPSSPSQSWSSPCHVIPS